MRRYAVISGAVLCVAAVGVVIVVRQKYRVPVLEYPPAPRLLAKVEVKEILARDFKIVSRVEDVPISTKKAFAKIVGLPFDLVNPGERFNSTDVAQPGVSSRRLVFAGLRPDSSFVLYEQGGIARYTSVAVFRFGENEASCIAILESTSTLDLADLRSAIRVGRFVLHPNKRGMICPK